MPEKFKKALLFYAVVCANPDSAPAQSMQEICDLAAEKAAADSDVPLEVMMAIARAETGRRNGDTVEPWPWTINHAGKGRWFSTSGEAIAFAEELLANNDENFDVGCFQINLHWHGSNFVSLDQAFDPASNASYAAQFLSELFRSEGSWPAAVAAYHSRTPEEAESYLAKVEAMLTEMRTAGLVPPEENAVVALAEPQSVARVNRFPLLQTGARNNGASLVPVTDGGLPLFAETP